MLLPLVILPSAVAVVPIRRLLVRVVPIEVVPTQALPMKHLWLRVASGWVLLWRLCSLSDCQQGLLSAAATLVQMRSLDTKGQWGWLLQGCCPWAPSSCRPTTNCHLAVLYCPRALPGEALCAWRFQVNCQATFLAKCPVSCPVSFTQSCQLLSQLHPPC